MGQRIEDDLGRIDFESDTGQICMEDELGNFTCVDGGGSPPGPVVQAFYISGTSYLPMKR